MKSANRKDDALQQGQLTLRKLGDELERLFYLSHGTVDPREAELQKITKFLGALNNPEIHRFVLLSRPVPWSRRCSMHKPIVHQKRPGARKA